MRLLSAAFLRKMSPKDPVGIPDIQVLEWAVAIFLSLSGDFGVEFFWPLRLDEEQDNVLESADACRLLPV
jgi:hypothetical protein